jgi:hypothetical protein
VVYSSVSFMECFLRIYEVSVTIRCRLKEEEWGMRGANLLRT